MCRPPTTSVWIPELEITPGSFSINFGLDSEAILFELSVSEYRDQTASRHFQEFRVDVSIEIASQFARDIYFRSWLWHMNIRTYTKATIKIETIILV